MPRYAHQKPVNRLYSYNLGYMNNYYKPLTTYIEKKEVVESGKRAPSEQPGHQSLAERLKTYPMDGTTFRTRATSAPPGRREFFYDDGDLIPMASKVSWVRKPGDYPSTALSSERRARSRAASTFEQSARYEVSEEDERKYVPIWMKHPYRLPIEDVHVPPHESSIWPESVPHFNLVSSYDAMIGYLGLRHPTMYR